MQKVLNPYAVSDLSFVLLLFKSASCAQLRASEGSKTAQERRGFLWQIAAVPIPRETAEAAGDLGADFNKSLHQLTVVTLQGFDKTVRFSYLKLCISSVSLLLVCDSLHSYSPLFTLLVSLAVSVVDITTFCGVFGQAIIHNGL